MTSVLHVISGLGIGGAEAMLVQLAAGLRERGFVQQVVSVKKRGPHADALEALSIPVVALECSSAFDAPRGLKRLVPLVRQCAPQILQGWMYHGDLAAAVAHRLAPGRKGRRLFWNLRASNTDQGGYGGIVRLGALLSPWPDLVIANSRSGLDFHRARGYRPRRVEVIPNGIDTARFRPDPTAYAAVRAELQIPDDAVVAIHVARVDPMKDHATFLKAMASTPQVQGVMVGAGTERLNVPHNVVALGLRRDTERLYAAADLVVSSSAFAEGFSNVIAEGMSAGLVPLATDVGDARAIVGGTGYIVPPRDAAALAHVLAAEAGAPADDRRARGLQARERIVMHFALADVVERYARLYEDFGRRGMQ